MLANRGLLILDPQTLEVRERIQVTLIEDLAVSAHGSYAIAQIGTKRQEIAERLNQPHLGDIASLRVIDLASGEPGETYERAQANEADVPKDHQLPPGLRFPVALASDGSYFVFSGQLGSKSVTYICPVKAGRLDLSSPVHLNWQATQLYPGPGSNLVAAFLWPRENPKMWLPDRPPHDSSMGIQLLDAARPQTEMPHYWGGRAGVSANQLYALTFDNRLKIINRRDGSEVDLFLEEFDQRLWRGVEWVLLAPSNGGFVKTRLKLLLIEKAAAGGEERPAGSQAEATGSPLTATTEAHQDMERQHIITHAELERDHPLLEVDPATCAAYTLTPQGTLVRSNLACLRETHRMDEGAKCTGLALAQPGLLVAVSDGGKQELRVRDPADLHLRQRFPLPVPMSSLVSRPNATFAFLSGGGKLWLLDCTNGQLAEAADANGPLPADCQPIVAGDGEHVYVLRGGTVSRFAVEGGKLVAVGSSPPAVPVARCLAVDEAGRYLGVLLPKPVTLDATAWSAFAAVADPTDRRDGLGTFAVLDARSLLPVYQVTGDASQSFAFDSEQSQLVTGNLTRCFPDGSAARRALPGAWQQELRSVDVFRACGGWFVLPGPGGIVRYRFKPITTSTGDWLR